jgi:phage protein D
MPDDTDVLRSARPTIVVDGEERAELALGLLTMTVHEDTEGLARCEATFGNWGPAGDSTSFLYFDRKLLDFGKDFVVKFADTTLFQGRVTALEGEFPDGAAPRITVLCDDRLQDLRMTRRTRSFENSSDADVLRTIADDHGLTAQIDLSGPTHTVLAQINQSDLAFARERARAAGGELWVEGRTFVAKARPARASANTQELSQGRNLRSFTVAADLAHQRTKVAVSGWDVSSKEGVRHEATDSLLTSELEGGESGPSILATALGARVDAVVHTSARNTSAAEAVANAYFRGIARRFVVGRGTAEGDVNLRVGRKVEITGVGALFSGKYLIVQTRHTFSAAAGYRTDLAVERPALGRP